MLAKITKDGVLQIIPQTETEIFALQQWYKENPTFPGSLKIFLQTEL